jgi:hypothetical protein
VDEIIHGVEVLGYSAQNQAANSLKNESRHVFFLSASKQ